MIKLKEFQDTFEYSSDSPSGLVWKIDKWTGMYRNVHTVVKGANAGGVSSNGYWEVKHDGKTYKCHRLIFMLVNNSELSRDEHIDHENGIRLDNTPSNLLKSNATLNSRNKGVREKSTTGIAGVTKLSNGQGNFYARATWQELDGSEAWSTFSFLEYGEEKAMHMAVEARSAAINRLQADGAGYSERHLENLILTLDTTPQTA